MESMIEKAENADKYELMSDGIVAEIEDKLFMIFTYGPEPRYYLADIHAGKIVAAISMFEGCKCVLAYDEQEGWRIDAVDENGNYDGSISWSMPTYWKGHNIIHFAAAKKHIGLYPGPEAVTFFAEKLDQVGCKYSKGSIQIPYSDELPLDLIAEIADWCWKTGNHA